MKKKHAAIVAATVICAFICPQAISASANSASPYWYGENGTGIYSADENCPLQVKSENLTFNITGFPMEGGSYASSVCAEYNFYNPTDGGLTARMLFPFGREPDYYSWLEDESTLNDLYGVTVNGDGVNVNLRYTYNSSAYDFDFAADSALLLDYKKTAYCLSENTAVTKVTLADKAAYDAAGNYEYINIDFTADKNSSVILTRGTYVYNHVEDEASAYTLLEPDYADSIYILGDMPEKFTVSYCNVTTKETFWSYERIIDEVAAAEISYESAGTLGEFLEEYNAFTDGTYAETDWFNFCVDLISRDIDGDCMSFSTALYTLAYTIPNGEVGYYAMRWFDYELSVEAGGYALNAVTAPTYPTISEYYNPLVFVYNYLLSPAATWDSFENLTITVNAPYYMLESSVNFTMTGSVEEGTSVYTAELASLPSEELSFSLCLSDDPYYDNSRSTALWIFVALFLFIPAVVLISGIIILIIFLIRKARKRKLNK